MDFYVNPSVYSSAFAFPNDVADKYLKLCKGEHIKVLIYILRNGAHKPNEEKIALETDLSVFEVKEAILFWADAGILVCNNTVNDTVKAPTVKKTLKPTREDVTRRGLEDQKLNYILTQAQLIFGRGLKGNELETLGWIYDDLGLDASVIIYILQYAKLNDKVNIRFIEALATDWVDKGVETIVDAEEQVRLITLSQQAWAIVSSVFGIERRKPSKKENELVLKWIDEWKISKEMLKLAYDTCVDSKSKFSFPYVAKITENWHNNGYKTPSDIKDDKPKNNTATYDIDLYEKMLNSKD